MGGSVGVEGIKGRERSRRKVAANPARMSGLSARMVNSVGNCSLSSALKKEFSLRPGES